MQLKLQPQKQESGLKLLLGTTQGELQQEVQWLLMVAVAVL
jgi:hypothetical protein